MKQQFASAPPQKMISPPFWMLVSKAKQMFKSPQCPLNGTGWLTQATTFLEIATQLANKLANWSAISTGIGNNAKCIHAYFKLTYL